MYFYEIICPKGPNMSCCNFNVVHLDDKLDLNVSNGDL